MVITVNCPSCLTTFPVDTDKIPVGGVRARCSNCQDVFPVENPVEQAPPPPSAEAFTHAPEVETPSFETPAEDSDWVMERSEDVDPGSLNIDPVETIESSVQKAMAEEGRSGGFGGPDQADTMALEQDEAADVSFGEPSDAFFDEPTTASEAEPAAPVSGFSFGKRDPKDKARRLARVLVSDMISYNTERHERALANGSLKEDFEEEIEKSWKEYVEQVGEEMATEHPFWVEALNDVLAKGEQIF